MSYSNNDLQIKHTLPHIYHGQTGQLTPLRQKHLIKGHYEVITTAYSLLQYAVCQILSRRTIHHKRCLIIIMLYITHTARLKQAVTSII